MKDHVYAKARAVVGDFIFDEQVAQVFPDMIKRSVPGYEMSLAMIRLIAKRFLQDRTRAYDLGCSLGASLLAIHAGAGDKDVTYVGVDNAAAMLDECGNNLQKAGLEEKLNLRCEDIQKTEIKNASLIVLNFTLQFIPKAERDGLLKKIAAGLNPGGVLILSEKICFADEVIQEELFSLHHDFKRMHGYSDLEISQKRAALEQVLEPETLQVHKARLKGAGFSHVEQWFQCFNFASLVAMRGDSL